MLDITATLHDRYIFLKSIVCKLQEHISEQYAIL